MQPPGTLSSPWKLPWALFLEGHPWPLPLVTLPRGGVASLTGESPGYELSGWPPLPLPQERLTWPQPALPRSVNTAACRWGACGSGGRGESVQAGGEGVRGRALLARPHPHSPPQQRARTEDGIRTPVISAPPSRLHTWRRVPVCRIITIHTSTAVTESSAGDAGQPGT